jgi:integrase
MNVTCDPTAQVRRSSRCVSDSTAGPGTGKTRTAASTLSIDLGATPATVQAQLGHSESWTTLSAYAHTVDKS